MTADERYAIEERAAIMEFDGGLTREEALRKATEAARQGQGELFDGDGKGNKWASQSE